MISNRLVAHQVPRGVVLAGVAGVLTALTLLEPGQPVRALTAAAVLMVLPGLAVADLLPLRDPLLMPVVAVATSLTVTVVVSTALFYAGVWTWQGSVVLVGGVAAAVALAPRREGPARHRLRSADGAPQGEPTTGTDGVA